MKTSISICMITYNRGKYLKEAIDSILTQSFLDWELIIVDNGSTDNSIDLINSYINKDSRIKLFINPINKISYSRNLALSKCSSKYVAVLDSDDVWLGKDKLLDQYNFLEKNPEYVLVGGGGITIDENSKEIGKITHYLTDLEIRNKMLFYNNFIHSSVLYVKEKAESCGFYDESINMGEDYDLWLKLGSLGKISNSNLFLVKYRVHSGNVCSGDLLRVKRDTIKIIKKYKKKYPNYYCSIIKFYYTIFKFIL